MVNLFDDNCVQLQVLVHEGQHYALWPDFAEIPPDWTRAYGPAPAEECRRYVATWGWRSASA